MSIAMVTVLQAPQLKLSLFQGLVLSFGFLCCSPQAEVKDTCVESLAYGGRMHWSAPHRAWPRALQGSPNLLLQGGSDTSEEQRLGWHPLLVLRDFSETGPSGSVSQHSPWESRRALVAGPAWAQQVSRGLQPTPACQHSVAATHTKIAGCLHRAVACCARGLERRGLTIYQV